MPKLDVRAKRKTYADLTGIDFSATGVKIVRVRKSKDVLSLVGADLLPVCPLDDPSLEVDWPKSLVANYAALAYTGDDAVLRIMHMALDAEAKPNEVEAELLRQLNLDETFRAARHTIQQGKGKQESMLLAVAVPRKDISSLMVRFVSGAPSPCSVEVAGLAAFSGFMLMHADRSAEESFCLMETGARVTTVAFMVRGKPALIAKFNVGAGNLFKRIEADLGVDTDMVRTILAGGSVDISGSVNSVMAPLLRQLSVSRDFVERQHKVKMTKVFISGGMAQSPYWVGPVRECMDVPCEAWDPLEGIKVPPGAWPEKLQEQQYRFAAALGAALGGLNEI